MKNKWLLIAAEMLEKASNEFSDHGCNDWDFPNDWTEEERAEFVLEMHKDNGNEDEFDPKWLHVPDWWVMSFLSERLLKDFRIDDV